MKKLFTSILGVALLLIMAHPASAQNDRLDRIIKKHVNKVVQKVEENHQPAEKRKILNESFDDMNSALERVEKVSGLSATDQEGIAAFRKTIKEHKNELNGEEGFTAVSDKNLDDFAHFVQQDLEQANEYITLSVGTAILIALILLLF